MSVQVAVEVAAPRAEVWDDVRRIASHVEWMSDAESIRFETDDQEGVGARFECITKVGPIRLSDRMEVTEWVEGEVIGIRHEGVVTGSGRFRLTEAQNAQGAAVTRFDWSETLQFPWWMAGPLGAALARPVLRAIWRRNLRRFAARFPAAA